MATGVRKTLGIEDVRSDGYTRPDWVTDSDNDGVDDIRLPSDFDSNEVVDPAGNSAQAHSTPAIITDTNKDGTDDARRGTDFRANAISDPSGGNNGLVRSAVLWDTNRDADTGLPA